MPACDVCRMWFLVCATLCYDVILKDTGQGTCPDFYTCSERVALIISISDVCKEAYETLRMLLKWGGSAHFSQSWVRGLASRAIRASPDRDDSLPSAGLPGRGGSRAGRNVMSRRRSSKMRCAAAARECLRLVSLSLNSLQGNAFARVAHSVLAAVSLTEHNAAFRIWFVIY